MDDDFEGEEDFEYTEFAPQKFSWVTLVRAGIDFAKHVTEGASCALSIIEHAVVSHEVKAYQDREFHQAVTWDLESIPETEE